MAIQGLTEADKLAIQKASQTAGLTAQDQSAFQSLTTPTYTTSGMGGTSQTNFSGGAITPAQMSPEQPRPVVTPINTGTPDTSSVQTTLSNSEKIINDLYGTPLPNESQQNDLRSQIMSLTGDVSQEASRRAQLEADPALQAKRQQVQDLTAQANALVAESKAIPIRIQQEAQQGGAIVTKGGLAPIQTAQLRNNAIQALSVGSLLSAAQGNLTLALDQVDRAVKAEFEPKKAELAAKRANLEMLMNDPALTREEKRRGAIAEARLKAEEDRTAKLEADASAKKKLTAMIAGYGTADSATLQKIQNAGSYDEAFNLAIPYMQDPKAKYELEKSRLDNILLNERIKTEQKQRGLLGEPTKAEREASAKEQKTLIETSAKAKAQIPVINAKLNLIDEITSNKALPFVVGPSVLFGYGIGTRSPLKQVTGEAQDFSAKVHQLTAGLTLDQLISAKERGATFGALSEGELNALARSATTLSDWEIKDANGKGTGVWNVDEKSFLGEIQKIRDLAERDKAIRSGEIFTPDEKNILDSVFSTPSTYQSSTFNPSSFFTNTNP